MSRRSLNPRFILLRCILSFLTVAFLFVVCVANVPLHDGEYYGPIIPSHQGKVIALVICIPFLIVVWVVDLGEMENRSTEGEVDSGHIQKRFDRPRDKSEGDDFPPDRLR
jgi:hypothetical protein